MSKSFSQAFLQHALLRPALLERDAVKFAYQSALGAEHFVLDGQKSLERLTLEAEGLQKSVPQPLYEELGGAYARLNLLPALEAGLSLNTLNAMFLDTANAQKGSAEGLLQRLALLPELAEKSALHIPKEALMRFVGGYIKEGCKSVSHSAVYRALYAPAYRVVKEAYARYFPLFARIDRLLSTKKDRVSLAIDGRCGAGKSTLAALLKAVYACPVIPVDGFFLQGFQRTEERLREAGGNVDHERLKAEVTDKLPNAFSYRPYDCKSGALQAPVHVPKSRLIAVEGSYALHPGLRARYDLTVFMDIGKEEQLRRLEARGGAALLQRFINEWIPMENLYFEAFNIQEKAELAFFANDLSILP